MNPHARSPALSGTYSRTIRVRRHLGWLMAYSLALGTVTAALAEIEITAPPSRLSELAMALGDAAPGMRADFAVITIAHMAEAHAAEAERARQEAHRLPRERDPRRWAGAVDAYAAQLLAIAGRVDPETTLAIRIGTAHDVYLVVDGTPVLVNGPLAAHQVAFEQEIIERFCALYPCEELIAGYQAPLPAARPEEVVTHWSFSQHAGPVCSGSDDLEFQFRDMSKLPAYRRACAQVIAELNTLVRGITRSRAGGVQVDWNALAIQSLPGSGNDQVMLNRSGTTILAPLPGLAATPRLFTLLRPWIAARVNGRPYPLVVINADRQLAPLFGQGADDWD